MSEMCGHRHGRAACDQKPGHDGDHAGPVGRYEEYHSWPNVGPSHGDPASLRAERDAWKARALRAEEEVAQKWDEIREYKTFSLRQLEARLEKAEAERDEALRLLSERR